jgi:ATP/maltotriose-dependent transcriptional regulator MalT
VEWGTSALLLAQSAVELAEGHPEAAWECAYLPPEKDTGSVNYEHFEAAMRAALALGDGARARSEVDRIDAVAAHTGNARARALAAYGRGRVALLDDDHRGAEPLLHAALGGFDDRGWRPGVIETLEALGECAAAQGASTPAARLLSAAEAARHALRFARIPRRSEHWDGVIKPLRDTRAWAEGTSLALDDAVAYARRTRGSRKRPTRGWASLTPIEAQVAELAAQGLTNPQIGERLFIARGTVKAHLRHVYEKLEISTRLELVMRRREASD